MECTPAWYDKVQITAVANIGSKSGYNSRTWTKHGKLPWVDYSAPQPAQEPELPFTDVQEGSWYAEAVRWAYKAEITAGTDETHFSPKGVCTRAQVVVFLFKFAKWLFKKLGLAWSE